MIVAMKHEKRRFVEHVDFITSPGLVRGDDIAARERPAARAACSASSPTWPCSASTSDTRG